jgi:hypothetical protein
MPGLIEAHCHIGITEEKKGLEGDDCNEMKEPLRLISAVSTPSIPWTPHFTTPQFGITSMMIVPEVPMWSEVIVFIKATADVLTTWWSWSPLR